MLDVVKILEKLVGFNTIKDKENAEILSFIENYLLILNKNFKIIKKDKFLIMTNSDKEDLSDVGIGFVGHTDTVDVRIDKWNTDPFKLTFDKDNPDLLRGLGCCDMKSGIASVLSVLNEIDLNVLKSKIILFFTYDEEIGFNGIKDVNSFMKDSNYCFPKRIIIGEPTNNEMLLGSKGLLEYKLTFKGIKVHSSNPEKGINSNLEAIKFINILNEFYEKEIKKELDNSFLVPYTTFNLGIMNGGYEINSVPDETVIYFDFRTITKNEKRIKYFTNDLIKDFDVKVEIINDIKAFKNESIFSKEIKTSSFITEASLIEGDCEKIILGAGPVNAHEVNECISISSLEKTIKQYKEIIIKSCS